MTHKLLLLSVAALIGIQGCATSNSNNGSMSALTPTTFKVNKLEQNEQQAQLPIYELLVAELSIRRGDNEVAVKNYLAVLDKAESPRIAERAVKIAAHANDIDSAVLAAKKWQLSEPENYKAYQVAGTLLFRQGLFDEAYEQFDQSVQIRGADSRLSFSSILSVLAREKNPEGVLTISQKLADNYPKNAYAQFMYGSLAAKLNRSQTALTYIDKALAIENIADAHGIKARLLLKLGRRTEAVKSLSIAVKNNPDNGDMRLTYARLLIDVKQYTKARLEFSKLLEKAPNDANLLYTLGLLSLESNQLDDAEKHLTKLLTMRHRRGEAVYYLGRINESKKDLAAAVKWYQQVNSGDFKFNAQIRVAKLFARMGDIEKANDTLEALKITHKSEATLVRIYLTEGTIYNSVQQYKKAMDIYNIALLKIPGNSDLLYARAITSEKVGRVDILERDLLIILKTEPDNANALNALGFSLSSNPNRLDDAYRYIKKAIALAPDEAAIIDSMGWIEFKLGNLIKAESLLRKAYAMLDDSEIAAHLVEVLWYGGKRSEAKSLLSSVLKNEPDSVYMNEVKQRLNP